MEGLHTKLSYSITPYPERSISSVRSERVSPQSSWWASHRFSNLANSPHSIWQRYKLKPIIRPPTQRTSFGLKEAPLHISFASLLLHFLINFSGYLEWLLINHYCQAFRETYQTLSEIRKQKSCKNCSWRTPVYCWMHLILLAEIGIGL